MLLVLGLGFLAVVAMVVLALQFRSVPGDAEAARDELGVAADALRAGDVNAAAARVESARGHVDRARGTTHGISGDLWQWVPVAGGGVRDVRHLVEALDDATSIAEIGVEVYPQLLGDRAKVVDGLSVDMDTLESIVASGLAATDHARHAEEALAAIDGTALLVGARAAAARDQAQAVLAPLSTTFDRAEPLLEELPRLLGSEDEQKYLVAILNPSELRYSGGATLALATVRIQDGQAVFRDIGNLEDAPATNRELFWKKVPGNPFRTRGKTRIQNATWSPYWSTSGEELLRAWSKVTKEEFDGVLAIDVPAIASLFSITGPIDVGEYGTLDEGNVVQTLIGSYDTYNDIFKRRALNENLIPIFRDKLFEGGQFVEKFQNLGRAADARHFAMYLRDEPAQAVVADLGVAGDLSDTGHDYLGVFTQNTNQAKVDYWQQRSVVSDVTLAEDGSARVDLTVTLANVTPPYVQDQADPRFGYFTRWSKPAVGVFFPEGARVRSTEVLGRQRDILVDAVGDRPFIRPTITLPPGETGTVRVRYDVPAAAEVAEDGTLTYRLDVDPQGMVTPEDVSVTVHWPRGYVVKKVPEGWARPDRRTSTWSVDGLVESPQWSVTGRPQGSAG